MDENQRAVTEFVAWATRQGIEVVRKISWGVQYVTVDLRLYLPDRRILGVSYMIHQYDLECCTWDAELGYWQATERNLRHALTSYMLSA